MSRGLRFSSEADMPESMRKLLPGSQPAAASPKRPHKYAAQATVVDGIRFDSKKEARYYERLKLRVQAGEVLFFLRQVPIHLPGGTRLVVDFLEFMADGSYRFVDTKGHQTEAFKVKRREMEAAYPLIRLFLV